MLQLAHKLASLLNTEVISSRIDGERIIFILASGGKHIKTEAELKKDILLLTQEDETSQALPAKPKKKGK